MTSTREYTRRINPSAVTLSRDESYGRNGDHAMGTCPECRMHVCLTHHNCQGRKESKI